MSAVTPCVPCCTTPQSVAVPGPQGPTGPAGPGTVTQVDYPGADAFLAVTNGTTTPHIALNGVLPVANGGTGVATLDAAWTALYTAADLAGNELPIAAGGTGADTPTAALAALGGQPLVPDPTSSLDDTGSALASGGSTPGARVGTAQVNLTKAGHWLLLLEAQFDATNKDIVPGVTWGVCLYNSATAAVVPNSYWYHFPVDTGSLSDPTTYARVSLHALYTTAVDTDQIQVYAWQTGSITNLFVKYVKLTAVWVTA